MMILYLLLVILTLNISIRPTSAFHVRPVCRSSSSSSFYFATSSMANRRITTSMTREYSTDTNKILVKLNAIKEQTIVSANKLQQFVNNKISVFLIYLKTRLSAISQFMTTLFAYIPSFKLTTPKGDNHCSYSSSLSSSSS